jgi:hypothetical protein
MGNDVPGHSQVNGSTRFLFTEYQNSQTALMNNLTYRQLLVSSKIRTMCAIIGLMILATSCMKSTKITTNAGGHRIRAVIAGEHSINSQPERGTISGPFGKITIERARVQIDDAPWTTIPEAVPVEVSILKGKVLLTAGFVTVKRTSR